MQDGWMLLFEIESINEDILAQQSDVDKKEVENSEFEYNHNLNEGKNLSAYEFDQKTSLLETEFSMVNSKKLLRRLQRLAGLVILSNVLKQVNKLNHRL